MDVVTGRLAASCDERRARSRLGSGSLTSRLALTLGVALLGLRLPAFCTTPVAQPGRASGTGEGAVQTAPTPAHVCVSDASGRPGQGVQIQITADGSARDLRRFNLTLQYGPALSFSGLYDVNPGSLLSGPGISVGLDSGTPGLLSAMGSGGQGTRGPGTLLTITAVIPDGLPPGKYPLTLTRVELFSADSRPLPSVTCGGTLTVLAPPSAQRGDVDGDGRLTTQDVLLALRFVLHLVTPTPEQLRQADADGDGRVVIEEVLSLLRRLA